jgi:hypothetical protein
MFLHALSYVLCLVLVTVLSGCTTVRPSAGVTSGPLFVPTSEDLPRLALLARDLDAKTGGCLKAATCEHIAFARALASLFESRETAGASFRLVIEYNPSSPLADTSRLWLRLIEHEPHNGPDQAPSDPRIDILGRFVREWMERELTERVEFHRAAAPPPSAERMSQEQPIDQSRAMQGMQRQLRERDRQIALLRSQLDALKFIDQDNADQRRKVKPPASMRTLEHYPQR